MAKSQMFGPPVLTYVYKHGGVFPVRRGHHDEEAIKTASTILEPGRDAARLRRGRALAQRRAGRGQAGDRPHRARIRRAGGPGRDPRLGEGAALEALQLPQGDRPVRRAARASRPRRRRAASASSRWRSRSSPRCGRCTRVGLALLVAGAEPGVELRVVPRGDDRVGVLAPEQLQLLQRAAVVVGVEGARRQRRVAVELGLRCRWRRRRSRSRACRGGRSPTCGRRCGRGCRRAGSSRRRRGRSSGRSSRRSRSRRGRSRPCGSRRRSRSGRGGSR